MRLPKDEHDGELPLERVELVLIHFGVNVRRQAEYLYLQKDEVLEAMAYCDPVPRAQIQWLIRTFNIDGVDFYFFGNTERDRGTAPC